MKKRTVNLNLNEKVLSINTYGYVVLSTDKFIPALLGRDGEDTIFYNEEFDPGSG
jgi:hypothetical protein